MLYSPLNVASITKQNKIEHFRKSLKKGIEMEALLKQTKIQAFIDIHVVSILFT